MQVEQHSCDFLCTNKATRRFGKLFICESCATHPENQLVTAFSDAAGSHQEEEISLEHPGNNGIVAEGAPVPPNQIRRRRLYSSEDLADARRFLSNLRPRTSWDWDEEEFMASAADRLYDVKFVGRFAQRVDWAIATYHARVEKANRLAQQRASHNN